MQKRPLLLLGFTLTTLSYLLAESHLGFDLKVPCIWIGPDTGDHTEWGQTPIGNYAILAAVDSMVFEGNKISRCTAAGQV